MKTPTLFTFFALALVSCTREAVTPIHTVIVIDSTIANLTALRQQAVLRYLGTQSNKSSISVLIACGQQVNTVFDGKIGEKLKLFQKLSMLITPCNLQGSPISEGLQQATNLLQEHDHTALIFITDGGLQDDPKIQNFSSVVKQLAATKGLKAIWIAGTGGFNELRSNFKEQLKPALGDRLIISGIYDLDVGLEALAEKLKS
jgi:hypothetical protein